LCAPAASRVRSACDAARVTVLCSDLLATLVLQCTTRKRAARCRSCCSSTKANLRGAKQRACSRSQSANRRPKSARRCCTRSSSGRRRRPASCPIAVRAQPFGCCACCSQVAQKQSASAASLDDSSAAEVADSSVAGAGRRRNPPRVRTTRSAAQESKARYHAGLSDRQRPDLTWHLGLFAALPRRKLQSRDLTDGSLAKVLFA
jgi:hypothetical protein